MKSRVGQRFLGQRTWVYYGCDKGFQGSSGCFGWPSVPPDSNKLRVFGSLSRQTQAWLTFQFENWIFKLHGSDALARGSRIEHDRSHKEISRWIVSYMLFSQTRGRTAALLLKAHNLFLHDVDRIQINLRGLRFASPLASASEPWMSWCDGMRTYFRRRASQMKTAFRSQPHGAVTNC